MNRCDDGWYREVLSYLLNDRISFDSYSEELILSLLSHKKQEELIPQIELQRDNAFFRLVTQLRKLWKNKCYREVLEFLINVRFSKDIDGEKLYKTLNKYDSMKNATKLAINASKKFEDDEVFTMSFIDWVELVYSEEVIGFEIDLENISSSDIDRMGRIAVENSDNFFRSLLQYFVSTSQYELIWYTLYSYIIPSFCGKNCRINKQAASSLRLYIGEIMGELWNLSYISGEIGLFIERGDSLFKILLSNNKESNEFSEAVNRLLFGDLARLKELCLSREVADGMQQLFLAAIHGNELIPRKDAEYFCHLITVVMLAVNMREEAGEFICANKEYFQFNSLEIVAIVTIVTLSSNNFETVNMLYGIFLTEKYQVDRLRSILSTYISEGASYLNKLKALYNNKEDRDIDLFNKKFFLECGVEELVNKTDKLKAIEDIDLLNMAKEMTAIIKAVSYDGSLKSNYKDMKIYFVYHTVDWSTATNREQYIETDFIPEKIKAQGKGILNTLEPYNPKINNLKYKRAYNIVNEAISKKLTYLYFENMSEIVGDILKEQPEKYRKYFNEWNEKKAVELFVNAYINHRDTPELSSYLRECFINKYNNGRVWDYYREAHQNGLFEYFKDLYIKVDNKYEEIFENEEVRKLLLTAEWLWEKECNDIEDIENFRASQEFTYLVANYLKAVEIFLSFKIEKAVKTANKIIYFEKKVRGYSEKILVGTPNWTREATMGDLYHLVMNFPELLEENLHGLIIKYLDNIRSNNYGNPVVKYLKKFTDEIRNGYFHKDTLLDFQRAFEIRNQTLFVIRSIIADFK